MISFTNSCNNAPSICVGPMFFYRACAQPETSSARRACSRIDRCHHQNCTIDKSDASSEYEIVLIRQLSPPKPRIYYIELSKKSIPLFLAIWPKVTCLKYYLSQLVGANVVWNLRFDNSICATSRFCSENINVRNPSRSALPITKKKKNKKKRLTKIIAIVDRDRPWVVMIPPRNYIYLWFEGKAQCLNATQNGRKPVFLILFPSATPFRDVREIEASLKRLHTSDHIRIT